MAPQRRESLCELFWETPTTLRRAALELSDPADVTEGGRFRRIEAR